LLPGEKEADYANIAGRIVRGSGPQDAIDLEILRLRRIKAGLLKAWIGDSVERVLNSLGHTASKAYGCKH
jgi:hypothetical protein